MFDASSKFQLFYNSFVVLSQTEQNNLREKMNLNIKRLKEGLIEYNKENNTSYKIVEIYVQGSMDMATVVQNDEKDYDIDVAIVFDKNILGDKGALATRNIVANALERKTHQFKTNPDVKTSCIRIKYETGYHIDFAIYRRYYDDIANSWIYEHAGSEWTKRELRGLNDWFKERNKETGGKLRKIIRISKMFCKSRSSWKMPSGLLQTVVCDEKLQDKYNRLDELFYYTMKEIISRLDNCLEVNAPVDNGRNLTPRKSDLIKMINWKNRLKSKLEDLDVLFSEDCTLNDAMQAWYGFFNHDYWQNQIKESSCFVLPSLSVSVRSFNDSEQYIEDMFPICLKNTCQINCILGGNGFRTKPLSEYLLLFKKYIPHNLKINCSMVHTNCSEPYDVYWKVKNVGPEAERRNQVRGQIIKRGKSIEEHSDFYGNHYIECYIVKNGICVARKRTDINIGR